MATDLATLINAIHPAEDGGVITTEYHNSVRAAVRAIGDQLGTSRQANMLTLAPIFTPNGTTPSWVLGLGVASRPGASAEGWIALQLPEGASIQSLTVSGRKSGAMASFRLLLQIQGISDSVLTSLIIVPLEGADDPFNVTVNLPPERGAAAVVDNRHNKYLIVARLRDAVDGSTAQINAIQVGYTNR